MHKTWTLAKCVIAVKQSGNKQVIDGVHAQARWIVGILGEKRLKGEKWLKEGIQGKEKELWTEKWNRNVVKDGNNSCWDERIH